MSSSVAKMVPADQDAHSASMLAMIGPSAETCAEHVMQQHLHPMMYEAALHACGFWCMWCMHQLLQFFTAW